MIVLDTSVLIYAAVDTASLSVRANQAIEEADRIILSSISIWEIGLKVKLQKLELPFSMNELVSKLQEIDRFEIAPVTEVTWLKNVELEWDHKDPADRTIVATAMLLNCPIVSNDIRIRQFYSSTIW
jgi:PIN domain nuclease of toxin-antitoxin system